MRTFDEDEIEEGLPCLMCNGQLAELGQLGNLLWLRCINCGSQQSIVNTKRDSE